MNGKDLSLGGWLLAPRYTWDSSKSQLLTFNNICSNIFIVFYDQFAICLGVGRT